MSKYSSIDGKLRAHVQLAKQELSSYDFATIKNEFNRTSTLQSSINSVISSNLDTITTSDTLTGSIKKIKSFLDNLENAWNNIKEVQQLEDEIVSLEARKWRTETYSYRDAFGRYHTGTEQVIDQSVVNEINQKQGLIREYEAKVDNYLK